MNNQLGEAIDILREVAKVAPIDHGEVGWDTPRCEWCCALFENFSDEPDPKKHGVDCAWRRANEFIDALEKED